MAETGLPSLLNGILLTVLLNVPWYISLSIAAGRPEYLVPLVITSILFGAIIGWMSQKLKPGQN